MNNLSVVHLYTPASSVGRLHGALTKGADVVIFDLEDAVSRDRKVESRRQLVKFLEELEVVEGQSDIHVRMNALDSPWGLEDLNSLASVPNLSGIRIPKVTSRADVDRIAEKAPELELHALIEDAPGVGALEEICHSDSVTGVSLGDNDLRAAFHLRGEELLNHLRARLVLELASAGKRPPLGSVFPEIKDLEGLYESSLRLRDMGFSGRTCIHPSQIGPIRRAFAPSQEEIDRATEIIEAAKEAEARGVGAVALPDGSFVDPPFVLHAEYVLSLGRPKRTE